MIKLNYNTQLEFNKIKEYLENGTINIVKMPDWRIDRVCPDFLNKELLREIILYKDKILHLGMGNGSCYEFFGENEQYSVSDKLYFDPLEVIYLFFQLNNLMNSNFDWKEYGYFLRNKFLIAINLNKLLDYNDKTLFNDDDIKIYTLYCHILDDSYEHTDTYAILRTLIEILNTLLKDICFGGEMREVTPFGKRIKTYKDFIVDRNIPAEGKYITVDIVLDYLHDRFCRFQNIFIETYEKLDVNEFNVEFDWIMGSRSDAFLNKRYWKFLYKILKKLSKNGIYFSDGVVSSYSYQFYYKEYLKFCNYEGINKKCIWFVLRTNISYEIPLKLICGIIYCKNINDLKKMQNSLQKDLKIISALEVEEEKCFIEQCAWSDIVQYMGENVYELESLTIKEIELLVHNIVVDKGGSPYCKSKNISNIIDRYYRCKNV